MIGYLVTYDSLYRGVKLLPNKTYELVGGVNINDLGYKFYDTPDVIFMSHEYKNGKTTVFKVKPIGNIKKCNVCFYTDKIKIIDEISISDFKKLSKNYLFDDNFNLIEEITEKKTYEYNEKGLLLQKKVSGVPDSVYEYDEKGNLTHFNGGSYEEWYEYDEKNNIKYLKDSIVSEEFYTYDEKNRLVYVLTQPNKIEHWNTYDDNGNIILQKDSLGNELYGQFDRKNNLVNFKTNKGYEFNRTYDEDNNLLSHEDNTPDGSFKYNIS